MFETDYTVTRATYDHLCVNRTPFHPPANHNFYSSQDLVDEYQLPTFLDFPTSQEEADYAPKPNTHRHPASQQPLIRAYLKPSLAFTIRPSHSSDYLLVSAKHR